MNLAREQHPTRSKDFLHVDDTGGFLVTGQEGGSTGREELAIAGGQVREGTEHRIKDPDPRKPVVVAWIFLKQDSAILQDREIIQHDPLLVRVGQSRTARPIQNELDEATVLGSGNVIETEPPKTRRHSDIGTRGATGGDEVEVARTVGIPGSILDTSEASSTVQPGEVHLGLVER